MDKTWDFDQFGFKIKLVGEAGRFIGYEILFCSMKINLEIDG